MKKNLLSVIILALLVVNLVMTSIMMFSVVGATNSTTKLVNNIASALELEIGTPDGEAVVDETVSMENIKVYDIKELVIPLTKGVDGTSHYAMLSVALSMNIEDEGYATYGETLVEKESLIKSEIVEAISSYTLEEIQADPDLVKEDILNRIQTLFDSKFIFKVAFSDTMYQ